MSEFVEYVLDQLRPVGDLNAGRMFGGWGIKCGDTQFAIIMGEALYFVVNDATRPKYEQAGSGPFKYKKKSGMQEVRRYYEVPADVLENAAELHEWAAESIAVSKQPK